MKKDRDCTAEEILKMVEFIVSDDFCQDLEWELANGHKNPEDLEEVSRKLGQIYRLVHSFLDDYSCYDVHHEWREEAINLRKILKDHL